MNTSTMTIGKKLTAGFAVLGLMMAFIGGSRCCSSAT